MLKIGLFTDTYRPSVNGIVFVVDILRAQLEASGHEVYVFCPTSRKAREQNLEDPHVIRFPSVKGAFFDDYDLSVFFPPREIRRIKDLNLDVVMFFTPGQIGLMGVYAAKKLDLPLVSQHSTDLYEYVEHYPATLPGIVALSSVLPFTIKMDGKDLRSWFKGMRPRRPAEWGKHAIERLLTLVHQKCDAVVVLSRKSLHQLSSWEGAEQCHFELIPTGVNALPKPTQADIHSFKERYGIQKQDKVILYVGRLGAEKNLDILIPAMEYIVTAQPHAKLIFVGDFEYRAVLEEAADQSAAADNIVFTGKFPRETLGAVYASADVFAFPSLKDTQGLVLHEAAHAGLPIVMADPAVSEVVREGYNGCVAHNTPEDFAKTILSMLQQPQLLKQQGVRSQELAAQFSEKQQADKLIALFCDIIERHGKKAQE